MAGIDGIKNKIDPGKSFDEDLYSLSEDEVKKLPTVCGSLREAMQNLDQDRKFLTQGGVFTDDQIDAYIDLKFQEIYKFEHTPHPIEFEMYYSELNFKRLSTTTSLCFIWIFKNKLRRKLFFFIIHFCS